MTRLEQLLNVISKEQVYIQMHNYPDQDALASAFGLQALLGAKGVYSKICYHGQIDQCSTVRMIELLNIEIFKSEEMSMEEGEEIILVDGQKGNVNMEDFAGIEIGCIDHHPMQDVSSYRFYDIRSDVGACGSMIAEYFVENNVEIPSLVATALILGIKIDTANLSRNVSNLDLDMFNKLYKIADKEILKKVHNNSLRRIDLVAYQKAISDLRLYGRLGVAYIGADCSEALLGNISDFLMTLSEIDCTLVYSLRVGGIKFSIRSKTDTIDAGKVIKKALEGLGDGGGHATMAAGFIPGVKTEKELYNKVDLVEKRIIGMLCLSK